MIASFLCNKIPPGLPTVGNKSTNFNLKLPSWATINNLQTILGVYAAVSTAYTVKHNRDADHLSYKHNKD